jgi:hypothetical protein
MAGWPQVVFCSSFGCNLREILSFVLNAQSFLCFHSVFYFERASVLKWSVCLSRSRLIQNPGKGRPSSGGSWGLAVSRVDDGLLKIGCSERTQSVRSSSFMTFVFSVFKSKSPA